MITIDKAITEAQAEETAEREVKKAMEKPANTAVKNMVTIPLDEYINLYTSTDKYCRLLALIGANIEPSNYSNDNMRISDSALILEFIKYNELQVYADMLGYIRDIRELEEKAKGGEDL